MSDLIDIGLSPEIAAVIRGHISAYRRREADPGDDGFWRLRTAASPDESEAAQFSERTAAMIELQRTSDLAALDEGLDAESIDVDTAHAWIRALNQLRLVLGTDLAVTDDDSWRPAPDQEGFAEAVVYGLLTQLQGWLVEAVSEAEGF